VQSHHTLPTASSNPAGIVAGLNGTGWFTENAVSQIGEISPTGVVTEYAIPTRPTAPTSITVGPDGNIWFTELGPHQLGRLTLPPATHLAVTTPVNAVVGQAAAVTVTAQDGSNGTAGTYRGTVHFTTGDPLAGLQPDYAFTTADNGTHTFSVNFNTVGSTTVSAADTSKGSITGTGGPITVTLSDPTLVAVKGSDQGLWVKIPSGPYRSYGGRLLAAPAVAPLGNGDHLYVVLGTDHQLYQRTDQAGYQPAGSGGTYCIDNPAVSLLGSGATIACMGGDHQLYVDHGAVDNTGVFHAGGWIAEGGYLYSGPAIGVVQNELHYFVEGLNHVVFDRTDATGYAPTPWRCIGHSGIANYAMKAYFTCHGTDGQEWVSVNTGGEWAGPHALGGHVVDGTAIAAYDGGATVYAIGIDEGAWSLLVDNDANDVSGWRSVGGRCSNGAGASTQ
jgi:hypothetical protein